MALFKIEKNQVQKIKPEKAEREKDIQTIFEQNLEALLGIRFLVTEYPTSFGGRIDTLGIDKDNSPVIIEYKKTQSESIINQGLSYLKWLLDHKEAFEKLADEKILGGFIRANSKINIEEIPEELSRVDWSSPRVICVAESYNKFDLDTIDILPIKIELFEYNLYENNILQLEEQKQERVKINTSGIIRTPERSRIRRLQKDYALEEHLQKSNQHTQALFFKLKEKITSLDENITEEPKKQYLAYKINGTNFADVIFYQKELRISLNVKSGDLKDPHNITTDFTKPKKGHWGNGDYEVKLENEKDVDAVSELIKQSYDLNK